jgi:hypothetical protein
MVRRREAAGAATFSFQRNDARMHLPVTRRFKAPRLHTDGGAI